jgi:hypothetical protein
MNCPYHSKSNDTYVKCVRGIESCGSKPRYSSHSTKGQREAHEVKYCNGKYTQCRNYKKLERDWGRCGKGVM